TWGAWMLWGIGLGGSFRAATIHQVNAHGEAQVLGWVGLFIMGFAYQAFPRLWGARLAAPWLGAWVFWLMVVGLVVRTAAMWAAGAWPPAAVVAAGAGALQVAAILTFVGQIGATFDGSRAPAEPYVGFIAAALGWFVAAGVVSVWHTWN